MRSSLSKLFVLALVLGFVCRPSTVEAYTIDGQIDDWNVQLETYDWSVWWYTGTSIVQDSFIPDPLGTIDYRVEDYWASDSKPDGGEAADYDAGYFDDSPDYFYVGIIASHPWSSSNTLYVQANGIKVYKDDFDVFAMADLGVDERYGGTVYPNYFYEAGIAKDRFGFVEVGASVFVYANCCDCPCDPDDRLQFCATTNYALPEPTTIVLLGVGIAGLGLRKLRRRRKED